MYEEAVRIRQNGYSPLPAQITGREEPFGPITILRTEDGGVLGYSYVTGFPGQIGRTISKSGILLAQQCGQYQPH